MYVSWQITTHNTKPMMLQQTVLQIMHNVTTTPSTFTTNCKEYTITKNIECIESIITYVISYARPFITYVLKLDIFKLKKNIWNALATNLVIYIIRHPPIHITIYNMHTIQQFNYTHCHTLAA